MESVENLHSFKLGSNCNRMAMHTDSHMVSKMKPKVRIIHIFAPEIIKTDVANFRELVQRLTGKPCESDDDGVRKKKTRMSASSSKSRLRSCDYEKGVMEEVVVEEDDEMMKYSSELFNGFADLNTFMHDFSFEASSTSSHIDNVFQRIM